MGGGRPRWSRVLDWLAEWVPVIVVGLALLAAFAGTVYAFTHQP